MSREDDINRRWRVTLARTALQLRRFGERLRSMGYDPQEKAQRWREAFEEAEAEELCEQTGLRQDVTPPLSELREAPEAEVHKAILEVYARAQKGEGPNKNDIIVPVRELLGTRGFRTTGKHVKDLADDVRYDEYRRPSGKRRS
jgi:hypothetical protein